MSGLFGTKKRPGPAIEEVRRQQKAKEAQERAEERAESQERTEMRGVQARRRLLRRGGLRLLFSPARQEGPGMPTTRMLGGGS
jgi:hypothetical protein